MRILHLEAGRHLHGGARQVLALVAGLAEAGVEGSLVATAGSPVARAAERAGLRVLPVPLGGDLDLAAVGRLFRLLRTEQPSLLHVHSRRGADFFGALAARLAGVPAVLTRRVDDPPPPLAGPLSGAGYRHLIAISDAVAGALRSAGVPADRISIVRSAVEPADCQAILPRAQWLARFGLADGAPVLACVAQLIPRKGHRTLLEAWPAIRASQPDAQLLVCGSGPLGGEIRARAAGLDGVTLTGWCEDLRDWIAYCDLLVHPALAEGLGIAVLEAQAAGVPVVASSAGGLPEAVRDGVTGLLVPPGDSAELAVAVAGLLADPARCSRMAAAGPVHVASNFSTQQMIGGCLAVYRSVLDEGAAIDA
ncbi:MAG: glycosyltransferase family 4 protein [Chromatiales bacterium]|nr:glycosyltransferase family 4 protein [Chromatiales bacterium]